MSEQEKSYTEYLIIGKDGFATGIRDDAPEEAKREYEKYIAKESGTTPMQ